MSASKTEQMLGISLLAATGPRDFSALAEVIMAFYDAIAQRPTEFVSLRNDSKIGRRRFAPVQFRKLVSDERIEEFHIGDITDPDAVVVECWLRPRHPEDQRFETRWITITGTGISYGSPPIREFMKTIVSLYEIAQGCVAEYRSLAYARKECSFSGAYSPFELDPGTAERLGKDQMLSGRFLRRLRRLYPVTIIGPRIWSELPAMPTFDPALTIEELRGQPEAEVARERVRHAHLIAVVGRRDRIGQRGLAPGPWLERSDRHRQRASDRRREAPASVAWLDSGELVAREGAPSRACAISADRHRCRASSRGRRKIEGASIEEARSKRVRAGRGSGEQCAA